jgi:uncharacterized repeat protein (TIGR02543 family)
VGGYTLSGTDDDTFGNSGSWTYALTVGNEGGVITQIAPTANAAADVAGSSFGDQLVTTGSTGTESFSETGTPPTGVSVSSTGHISSTSAASFGSYTLSGHDSDSFGNSGSWTYVLTISSPGGGGGGGGGSPPSGAGIVQTSSTSGVTTTKGSSSFTAGPIEVSGATGTVNFVTTSLASGLDVSSSGMLTTTGALTAGFYTVSGIDSDSNSDTGTWTYTLTVNGAAITVTFNANGGSGSMAAESKSAPTALSSLKFTRTGYKFAYWNTAANGSGTSYANGATFPFVTSVILYAQWNANPLRNVNFSSNGGIGIMLPEFESVPTDLTLNVFTRTGYKFAGWNTVANGSGTSYANGIKYSFTTDVTLYAQWSNGASFIVTFKANGGTGSMAPETKRTPGTLTLNRFTRSQHRFFKWTTVANGSGSSYANGATFLFTRSMTLYAQWHVVKKPVALPALNAVITLSAFADNSSTLSASLKSQIVALAHDVKANRDTKISLVGYSGKLAASKQLNESAWAANLKISGERASQVEAYLKQELSALGVRNYSITAVGTGHSDPPGSVASEVSQAKNRCVIATIT